jgi:hypothetical protein
MNPNWNKGKFNPFYKKKHSKVSRDKMSASQKEYLKLHPRQSSWNKGKTKDKFPQLGNAGQKTGEKHWNWMGGISFEIYPIEFNRELKLKIRKRDKFKCQLCGISEKQSISRHHKVLCVNHIDYNKQNCSEENLNTLCIGCNAMVNGEREKWTLFFKEKNEKFQVITHLQTRL